MTDLLAGDPERPGPPESVESRIGIEGTFVQGLARHARRCPARRNQKRLASRRRTLQNSTSVLFMATPPPCAASVPEASPLRRTPRPLQKGLQTRAAILD